MPKEKARVTKEGDWNAANMDAGEKLDMEASKEKGWKLDYEPVGLPDNFMTKLRGRAIRHFKGENIHHRVVEKDEKKIVFLFNRRTMKYSFLDSNQRVTIKLRKRPEKQLEASP